MNEEALLRERIGSVRDRIARAAARVGRAPDEVTLVGVGKRHPASRVAAAVRVGLRVVAENYAQEAEAKIPEIREKLEVWGAPEPLWHFVGQLQRNKARIAASLFDCVESVDRLSLARALDRRAGELGRLLPVLLQVDFCGGARRGGAAPEELEVLLAGCRALPSLRVTGLMTVPAWNPDPEAARPSFARLRDLARRHGLPELSMGMSADLEVAVEEGATMVRVGTAIFGPRDGPETREG